MIKLVAAISRPYITIVITQIAKYTKRVQPISFTKERNQNHVICKQQ